MARGSLNFFELHLEKIVVGLLGAFAAYMFVSYFVLNPNKAQYGSKTVGPGDVREEILARAQQLDRAVKSAQPKIEPIQDFAGDIRKSLQSGVLAPSKAGHAPLPKELVRSTRFSYAAPVFDDEQSKADIVVVTPLRPENAVLTTGRALVLPARPQVGGVTPRSPGQPEPETGEPKESAWVTVAAWFPIEAQRNEMTKAGYPPYRAKAFFTGVEAQRQELLSNGEWSDWAEVTLTGAMPQFDVPDPAVDDNGVVVNRTELDAAFDVIKTNQTQIQLIEPKFFPVRAGDPWRIPPLEGLSTEALLGSTDLPTGRPGVEPPAVAAGQPRPATGAQPTEPPPAESDEQPAQESPAGGGASRKEKIAAAREQIKKAEEALSSRNFEEALRLAEPVLAESIPNADKSRAQRIVTRAKEAMAAAKFRTLDVLVEHPGQGKVAIWFHDDSVEAGKTYRYRVRANLWNRYAGQVKEVKNDEDAKRTVLKGEWSLPSSPIVVTPDSYFFAANASVNNGQARVEVFKWRKGDWIKQAFDVGVGDVIGAARKVNEINETIDFTTGAVVLDIQEAPDFPGRQRAGKKGEFDYRPFSTVIVTYLDPADGRVKQMYFDKYDPLYERLRSSAI